MARAAEPATWEKLLSLFFPTALFLLLQNSSLFFERILLSRHSLESLNGSMQAYALLQLFQIPLIVFANTTNLFIEKNRAVQIGNRIWQVIWISLLSMLVIFPLSLIAINTFFIGTTQGDMAKSYFMISILGSSLFPIVAILCSFFRALGKNWLIFVSLLIAVQLDLILNLLLIPSFGVIGAAWSGLISKLLICLILLSCFLSRSNQENYHTLDATIDWSSIWQSIRRYNPRFVGAIITFLSWAALTYCMAKKGDLYLSVLSIGSTLTFFSLFFSDSLFRSLLNIFSADMESKEYQKIEQAFRYGFLWSFIFSGVLAIPFLVCPKVILSIFFEQIPIQIESHLLTAIFWSWVWIFISNLNSPILAFIFSSHNEYFYTKLRLFIHLATVLQAYYFIYHLDWEPNVFWVILCLEYGAILLACSVRAYFFRKAYLESREAAALL